MEKGPDAFRTISEVAEDLDLPQHVLRFWETRFPQIRPLKRGGGRRYYRPDDVELLRGIRHLLYGEGYTIRGVQRILKEEGPRYVQGLWRDIEADEPASIAQDQRDAEVARAPRQSPSADAGAPRRAPEEEPPRSGPLGGILNLLPGRQRDAAEEAPARRARRRPDTESDTFDLPLLADLDPPARPTRHEPPPIEAGLVTNGDELPRHDVPPMDALSPVDRNMPEVRPAALRPGYREPRSFEPVPVDVPAAETRGADDREAPLRPAELRASFPFRPVGAGPVSFAPDDEVSFVPERARGAASAPPQLHAAAVPAPSEPMRPVMSAAPVPPRAGGVHNDEAPARARLSREDVQRLQAALYELQDCQRLLDAARDRSD